MTDLSNPPKLTGGSVNYYRTKVGKPVSSDLQPYTAECNDLIETLQLTWAEANIFKEIWRTANARLAQGKPGHTALYGAEKIHFYAERNLALTQKDQSNEIHRTSQVSNGSPIEGPVIETSTTKKRPYDGLPIIF